MISPYPTFDEFMCSGARNAYVNAPGFAELYVRHARRVLAQNWRQTIDLARMEAVSPGNGAFTALLDHVRTLYPDYWIFVECVQNRRFEAKLLSLGFTQHDDTISPSFYLPSALEQNAASGVHPLRGSK
jgi:hypothetical protein